MQEYTRKESMIIEINGHTFRTIREDAYYFIIKDIRTGIYYYVMYDESEAMIDEVHELSHELNIEPLELTEALGIGYDAVNEEYSGVYHIWQDMQNKH